MKYLQTAFTGEGPTDFAFLKPLAARCAEDLLLRKFTQTFEVGSPLDVLPNGTFGNAPAAVVAQVPEELAHVELLFYHTDAGNSVARAYEHRVQQVQASLAAAGWSGQVVGVVPKREMEAWVLPDAFTLCAVLGLNPAVAPVPVAFAPARVEGVLDPKQELATFVARHTGRRRHGVPQVLSNMSAGISLQQLAGVPQFS